MGEASRRKWANRTEAMMASALAQSKSKDSSAKVPVAMRWFRGVGLSSILIGGLGLMQTFFWPSVIAIYAGVVLLLVDLWLEDFQSRPWTKIPIAGVFTLLCVLFTHSVVLRKDPILVSWRFWNDRLEVYVDNVSEDDYLDMDIKIKPDFPNDFVADMKQETHMPNVSFVDALPVGLSGKGESMLKVMQDPALGDKSIPDAAYTNFLRFRCDKLPKNTNLKFSMSLIKPVKNTTMKIDSVSEVTVIGSYRGKFRNYDINQKGLEPVLLTRENRGNRQ